MNSSGSSIQPVLTALLPILSAIPSHSSNFWHSLCHLYRSTQLLPLSPKAEVAASSLHCSAMEPKYQQYQLHLSE